MSFDFSYAVLNWLLPYPMALVGILKWRHQETPSCLLFLNELLPKEEVDSWVFHHIQCLSARPCCFSFSLLQDLFIIKLLMNINVDEVLCWCIFLSRAVSSSVSPLGSGTLKVKLCSRRAGSTDLGVYYLINSSIPFYPASPSPKSIAGVSVRTFLWTQNWLSDVFFLSLLKSNIGL